MRTKSKQINFRVSEKDYTKILKRIEKTNTNISGYFLTLALNGKIVVVEGLERTIIELNKIGTNLNQITKLCNQGLIYSPDLRELRLEVSRVWQLLNSLTQKEV